MVILYSTNCPRCRALEMRLDAKGIEYETCTDTKRMLDMGMTSAPALEADGRLMNFADAIRWLNSL